MDNFSILFTFRIKSDNNSGGLRIASDRLLEGTAAKNIGFYNNACGLLVQNNGNVEIKGYVGKNKVCKLQSIRHSDMLRKRDY